MLPKKAITRNELLFIGNLESLGEKKKSSLLLYVMVLFPTSSLVMDSTGNPNQIRLNLGYCINTVHLEKKLFQLQEVCAQLAS